MLIIGSYALYRDLDKCNDIDIIAKNIDDIQIWIVMNKDLYLSTVGWISDSKYLVHLYHNNRKIPIEFEVCSNDNSSKYIYEYCSNLKLNEDSLLKHSLIAPKEVLLLLKESHKYKKDSSHFWKTMQDIEILKLMSVVIPPNLIPVLKKRECEVYNYSHPSLNQTASNFFDDSVKYLYNHDSIHVAIKLYDKPAYQYFIKYEAEVLCSQDKFSKIPYKLQLAAVYEEACVLALERSLIPFPNKKTPDDAFLFALAKVCTSITSGWFREFAYNNAFNCIELYQQQINENHYYSLYLNGLKNNIIKKYEV